MTIMLFNDGRIVTAEAGQPINIALDGLLALIVNPQEGDVLTYNGKMWINGAAVLYVHEAEGEDDAVILDKTYADIAGAVGAGRAVYVASVDESENNVLVPLATYGGNDSDGYTVTAGEGTYTADTADGVLTKQAAGGGE